MHSKSSQRKAAKHKKTSRDKISKRSLIAFSKKNHLEATKRSFGIRTKATTHKKSNLPVTTNYGAVCSRLCFSVEKQEEFEKQQLPKYQVEQNFM